MEIVDAIKNAMRKVEGTNKRCLISCEWDDPENGWQDDVVLGTQERLHPDYANEKFFYPIQGWSIENEEGFVSREEAENDEDIRPVPENMEDPVYDRENNEWVERKEWIENAIDFFLDTGKINIEEIEKEFYEELPYHDKVENIQYYPSNLKIIMKSGTSIDINYDGQQGEFSRDEWEKQLCTPVEDGGYEIKNKEAIEEILRALENTSNDNFFAEEEEVLKWN